MTDILRLIWDDWNIAHIARHAVVPEEVEQVCQGLPMFSETYGDRLRVVGPTRRRRMLTIILAPKEAGFYYPVTARPASRKERRRYQELLKGGEST